MKSCASISRGTDFRPVGNESLDGVRSHFPLLGEKGATEASVAQSQHTWKQPGKTPMRARKHQ